MMRIDSLVAGWLSHGWLMLLALTAALLIVGLLRRPFRRLFGAERAFQLWLLPLLAILASQLPRTTAAPGTSWSTVISAMTTATAVTPAHFDHSNAVGWRTVIVLVWIAGTAISWMLAVRAQRRYRIRMLGATVMDAMPSRYPVLRALSADVGPAVVGAWRARIVLPADFFDRYDAIERALILAHETIHARRGDGWWCLLARGVVAGFWFHPLAWFALAALRQDQELACDAAVLREHRGRQRSYASAMLKTQTAVLSLPIGCLWSPRHPITERIAMLKVSPPNLFQTVTGSTAIAAVILGMSTCVYAAKQSAPPLRGDHFQLLLDVSIDGQGPRLRSRSCLEHGQYYEFTETDTGNSRPWHGRFTVAASEGDRLEVRGELSGGSLNKAVHPKVRTPPGQQAIIQVGEIAEAKDGKVMGDHTIKISVTPSVGC
jgi:beta-lactamase regulating signal transducer with metallopeptidase domain